MKNIINCNVCAYCVTEEHRSMMETAYVYGSKYQFILITGGPVLRHLEYVLVFLFLSPMRIKFVFHIFYLSLPLHLSVSVYELSHSSRVWFLHCRGHSGSTSSTTSERCPWTRMRKPLSTLSLHSFLQLMEAPLVVRRMEI